MEHFALLVLEWMGRAIAQRAFNSSLSVAWRRISPLFKQLLESASLWRMAADENIKEVEKIEAVTDQVLDMVTAANDLIHNLQQENAELKQRLANYEKSLPRNKVN